MQGKVRHQIPGLSREHDKERNNLYFALLVWRNMIGKANKFQVYGITCVVPRTKVSKLYAESLKISKFCFDYQLFKASTMTPLYVWSILTTCTHPDITHRYCNASTNFDRKHLHCQTINLKFCSLISLQNSGNKRRFTSHCLTSLVITDYFLI